MKPLTPQQIFDRAYTRIVAQGYPCVSDTGDCRYFDSSTGHRCAAGILLSKKDAAAVEATLGGRPTTYSCLPPKASAIFSKAGIEDVGLIDAIQDAHDIASTLSTKKAFLREFKSNMRNVAEKYNLTIPRKASK